MLIYYGFTIITLLFYGFPNIKTKNKSYNPYIYVSFILLLLVGVLRFDVGTDFMPYYRFFNSGSFFDGRFEIGYSILNYLTAKVFGGSQAIFIVTHTIIMVLAYLSIDKYSLDKKFSILLFVFGFFFFDAMNGIRQYIAVLICLYGHGFLTDRKTIKFIIITLIATTFHYSALITLILIPLRKYKLTKMNVVLMYISVLLFNVFYQPVISYIFRIINLIPYISRYSIYESYLANDVTSKPYDFIVYSLILILSYLASKNKISKLTNFNLYSNSLVLSIFLKGIALKFNLIDRVGIYFSIYIILLLPMIFESLKFKDKRMIKYVLIVLFAAYCFVRIKSGQAGVMEYKLFLMTR
jgi:hypothetical protein